MNYLIIKDNRITQVCTSIKDLLEYLEVKVTDEGVVEITNDGRQLPTSYNMKEYTKEEVMKNVITYQLKNIEVMLQIGIYKLERI
jgi:DNA gyrase/topoisomerase IV subunit B